MADLLHKDDPARIYEIKEVLLTHFLADKTISKHILENYRINLMSQGIYGSMIKEIPLSDFSLKDQDTIQKINKFEKKLDNFEYSGIEWRPLSYLNLNREQNEKIVEILESLEELDDVQNIYTNANLGNIKL